MVKVSKNFFNSYKKLLNVTLNKADKIKTEIIIPDELTISIEDKNISISLESIVCNNRSSSSSGHYIAYKKIENKWYLFDDSSCSEININDSKIK